MNSSAVFSGGENNTHFSRKKSCEYIAYRLLWNGWSHLYIQIMISKNYAGVLTDTHFLLNRSCTVAFLHLRKITSGQSSKEMWPLVP